jgi:hypothetical protein
VGIRFYGVPELRKTTRFVDLGAFELLGDLFKHLSHLELNRAAIRFSGSKPVSEIASRLRPSRASYSG